MSFESSEVEPGPAAVDPQTFPVSGTNAEVLSTKADVFDEIANENLRELVKLLPRWRPHRHGSESRFHDSFRRFLVGNGYQADEIEHEPRINRRGDAPEPDDNYAIPDFIIRGEVLVEIKRNFDMSSSSDRAVGQVTRYISYWRKKGPSVLLVCNEFDEHFRAIVDDQVKLWRSKDIPVYAHYVRS